MKKWFTISIICTVSHFLMAQNVSIQLIDTTTFPNNSFDYFAGTDHLENYYFVTYEAISKVNKTNTWNYANYELGVPTYISIINPLQIMVFYKEANTVVFLDRFLNETQRVNLNTTKNPITAWWVSNTKNKEIWIFDGANNNLNYFSYLQNLSLAQTIPLLTQPKDYTANFNNAYILTKESILQYNIQGSLVNSTKHLNASVIKSTASYLLAYTDKGLHIYDTNLNSIGTIEISKNLASGFSLTNEKLYIYDGSKLFKYKVLLPPKN